MDAKQAYELLSNSLLEWLTGQGWIMPDDGDEMLAEDIYTDNLNYLWWTTLWHAEPVTIDWLDSICEHIAGQDTVIDVGAGNGFSGLTVQLITHKPVTFYDMSRKSVSCDFIRWFCDRLDLVCDIREYGEPLDRYDVVIAAEVLEHTGNQLAALRWFKELGDRVYMCYPTSVPWLPPYIKRVDDWVDDAMIVATVASRYSLDAAMLVGGRRFVSYR